MRAITPPPRHRKTALSLFMASYVLFTYAALPVLDPSYVQFLPNHGHISLTGSLVVPPHLHGVRSEDRGEAHAIEHEPRFNPEGLIFVAPAEGAMASLMALQSVSELAVASMPSPPTLTVGWAVLRAHVLHGWDPPLLVRPPSRS